MNPRLSARSTRPAVGHSFRRPFLNGLLGLSIALGLFGAAAFVAPADARADEDERYPSVRLRAFAAYPSGVGVDAGVTLFDRLVLDLGFGGFAHLQAVEARIGARIVSSRVPTGSTGVRWSLLGHAGYLGWHSQSGDASSSHDLQAALGVVELEGTWIGEHRAGLTAALSGGVGVPLSQTFGDSKPQERAFGVFPYVGLALGVAF